MAAGARMARIAEKPGKEGGEVSLIAVSASLASELERIRLDAAGQAVAAAAGSAAAKAPLRARVVSTPQPPAAAALKHAHQRIQKAAWRLFQVAALSSAEAALFSAINDPGASRLMLSAPAFLILGWLARKNVKAAFLIGAAFYGLQTLLLILDNLRGSSLLAAFVGGVNCLMIYRLYRAYDLLRSMEQHGLLE